MTRPFEFKQQLIKQKIWAKHQRRLLVEPLEFGQQKLETQLDHWVIISLWTPILRVYRSRSQKMASADDIGGVAEIPLVLFVFSLSFLLHNMQTFKQYMIINYL